MVKAYLFWILVISFLVSCTPAETPSVVETPEESSIEEPTVEEIAEEVTEESEQIEEPEDVVEGSDEDIEIIPNEVEIEEDIENCEDCEYIWETVDFDFTNAVNDPRFVFRANDKDEDFVIYNGVEGERYSEISGIRFVDDVLLYNGFSGFEDSAVFRNNNVFAQGRILNYAQEGAELYIIEREDEVFLVDDGKETSLGDFVWPGRFGAIQRIDGKVFYTAQEGEDYDTYAYFDGDKGERFDAIEGWNVLEKDGLPVYNAELNNKRYVIHGSESYGPYNEVTELSIVDDKISFIGHNDDHFIHFYGGTQNLYDGMFRKPLLFQEGDPVIIAKIANSFEVYFRGEVVEHKAIDPESLHFVGGKLAYVVRKLVERKYRDAVYFEGETSEYFDKIKKIADVGGKVAFVGEREKKDVLVFDGEEIGEHERVKYLIDHDSLTYNVVDEDSWIVSDGLEGPIFEEIYDLKILNDKISYFAKKNGEGYLVHGKRVIGPFLTNWWGLEEINGKITFPVIRGGKSFVVHDEMLVSKGYDGIKIVDFD